MQGSAQISLSATRTDIDLRSPQVVIDWTEDAGTPPSIFPEYTNDFLPLGRIGAFTGIDGAAAGYTVLNRVFLPGRAAFNGVVQSSVGGTPGGEVWFYSPTGIYIGPRATFNVGSLVLTTNDVDIAGGLYSPNSAIRFRGAPSSAGEIYIDRGAKISAVGSGDAYLALVAPSIVQHGELDARGSIALVAAEAADITIDAGLIDVVVTQGTTALNGINHSGTTGGPITGATQIVRMIAVPKNDAMTMLLSGRIGYRPAAQVTTDGTAVVLEAGSHTSAPLGSMQMGEFGNVTFTSPMSAFASGDIEVAPATLRGVDFLSSAALTAGSDVTLSAVQGARINADAGIAIAAGNDGMGGTANIVARGSSGGDPANIGRITIASLLDIDVRGQAGTGNSNGGSVIFDAVGGTMTFDGIAIDASGIGPVGGAGLGGDVLFRARNQGSIAASSTLVRARGAGGAGSIGGDAVGGSISMRATGGQQALGNALLDVGAAGGSGTSRDGDSAGGLVSMQLSSASNLSWNDLAIDASASTGSTRTTTGGRITAAIAPGEESSVGGDLAIQAIGSLAPTNSSIDFQGTGARVIVGGSAIIAAAGAIDFSLGQTGALDIGGGLVIATPDEFRSNSAVTAGTVDIAAAGIAATVLDSRGQTRLQATGGPIRVSQDLRSTGPIAAEARSLEMVSAHALNFARASATAGDLSLQALGDLSVAVATAADDVTLVSAGDLRVGELRSNSASLIAGGALFWDGRGDITTVLSVETEGSASIGSVLAARQITIGSADVNLGPQARIGERGTTESLRLIGRPATAAAFIGGSGQSGAYSLDAGEVARLFADGTIAIELPFAGQTSASMNLGDFTMSFGAAGNIGTGGLLAMTTNARVEVVGNVELAARSVEDRFRLSSRNIMIDPVRGGVTMRDGNMLRGTLTMIADSIFAATPEVRTVIADGAAPAAVATALGNPAGMTNAGGYFGARRIEVAVRDGFYVQNSGANASFDARRGFSTGSLAITTEPGAVVAINGRTFDSNETPLTGLRTIESLTINSQPAVQAQGVRPASSVNGCALGADCDIDMPVPRPPLAVIISGADITGVLESGRADNVTRFPVGREPLSRQDGISSLERNETLEPGEILERQTLVIAPGLLANNGSIPPTNLLSRAFLPYLGYFQEPDPVSLTPLIDEPVTGVGNDDLWLGRCPAKPQLPNCPAPPDDTPSQ